jgi:hypothetical protein
LYTRTAFEVVSWTYNVSGKGDGLTDGTGVGVGLVYLPHPPMAKNAMAMNANNRVIPERGVIECTVSYGFVLGHEKRRSSVAGAAPYALVLR